MLMPRQAKKTPYALADIFSRGTIFAKKNIFRAVILSISEAG